MQMIDYLFCLAFGVLLASVMLGITLFADFVLSKIGSTYETLARAKKRGANHTADNSRVGSILHCSWTFRSLLK